MATFGRRSSDNGIEETIPNAATPSRRERNSGHEGDITSVHLKETLSSFREQAYLALMERIDLGAVGEMPIEQLRREIEQFVGDIATEKKVQLNVKEQRQVATSLVDDMVGLGPLEVLLADDSITDIMVNGPKEVYIETGGKLKKTAVTFHDDAHVLQVARRIAGKIGRRIDEASPLVDARLMDGSRVNIVVPPLALDGTSISIRKFSRTNVTLEKMVDNKNLSHQMASLLKIAGACRLNLLISGGTGSGKTTLLNAISKVISPGERIVTIEDAAELRLQQPHIVRLESRPPNIEGRGEITIRDLLKNALRMRPDRIIVGEVRGAEVQDMLQAMNTGHDGSMSTLHANNPREVLTRLENMMSMSGNALPLPVIRAQIAGAVNLIVHVERMRDGIRRVTAITEITGIDSGTVMTHDLFKFEFDHEETNAETGSMQITGKFISFGTRPSFYKTAKYFGLDRALDEALRVE